MGLWFCAQESLCEHEVGKQRVMLLGSPWPGGSSYRCAPGHAVLPGSGPETAGSAQENRVAGADCLGSQQLPQHFPLSCLNRSLLILSCSAALLYCQILCIH